MLFHKSPKLRSNKIIVILDRVNRPNVEWQERETIILEN